MKFLFKQCVLLAFASLAASVLPAFASQNKTIPTIEVILYFQNSNRESDGGSLVGTTLAAISGQEDTWNGQNGICHIQANCKTVETTPGHFGVQVHYSIYLDVLKKNIVFDRVLTVLPKSNDLWERGSIKVDHNIYTAAYLIDPDAQTSN